VCFLTRSFSSPEQGELLKRGAARQGHVAPAAVAVRTAVIREHPAARDPLAAKPGHGSDQKPDSGGLLLIGQNL